ncbi:MAG: phosphate signaling complex protein PhoU [Elusimicrobiales bacterium]|nr:phosphate signaling complex protein PhoU [Elusimicrobiales bacterium]
MHRHFEDAEEELKQRLLRMGGLVEDMLSYAGKGLLEKDETALKKVYETEAEVNRLHIELDDRALKLIALHQPAAADVRFTVACIKINSDLERIGDQAMNIAQNTEIFLKRPPLAHTFVALPRMVELAASMLKNSLDAFVGKNVELAGAVLSSDTEEDRLKSAVFHAVMGLMQNDASTVQSALCIMLIARNLERIADHATNISEDVIFMVRGTDVRHHSAGTSKIGA